MLSLILDESKWLTVAMGTAILAVTLKLYRQRRTIVTTEARLLSAMTLVFAGTISVMAFGHLLAVTLKLLNGTLSGSPPVLYMIGVALAVPSWSLLFHTLRQFNQIHSRATLFLNGWLAITLVALGLPNLPLALAGMLNVAYQVTSRRVIGWAIAGATLVLTVALFIGSLIFWASGQTFEQFSGMQ